MIVAKEVPVCARMTVVLDKVLVLEQILAINTKLMVAQEIPAANLAIVVFALQKTAVDFVLELKRRAPIAAFALFRPTSMTVTVLNMRGRGKTFHQDKALNFLFF